MIEVVPGTTLEADVEEYIAIKGEIKAHEAALAAIADRLKKALGDLPELEIGSRKLAWQERKSYEYDVSEFRALCNTRRKGLFDQCAKVDPTKVAGMVKSGLLEEHELDSVRTEKTSKAFVVK